MGTLPSHHTTHLSMENKSLLTEKKAILNNKISTATVRDLEDGEVLLKIDKFALTSNNVTYAVVGYQVKYWDFFPSEEPFGIVPVWGFATVQESKSDEISVGEKIYGYFPMSEYLITKPGRINSHMFTDMTAHRQALPPAYNNYNREGETLKYPPGFADYIPVVKPLFFTSFLINEFLKGEQFFGAQNVIITSASSKTSLGLAFALTRSKEEHGKKIVGLTSPSNVEFVKSTGFYDEVIEYRSVTEKVAVEDTIIVDMAGNGKLNRSLYTHLGQNLKHLAKVGLTDWSAADPVNDIPMAKFFFAPDHAQVFFKTHGPAKATELISKSIFEFVSAIEGFMEIEYLNDFEALKTTFVDMMNGKVDPKLAYIFNMS